MKENIGRLERIGGEGVCRNGEDNGVNSRGSSENIGDDSFGQDVGSAETSRAGDELGTFNGDAASSAPFASTLSGVVSTRLRFVGGSSVYSECFFCRE